MNLTVLYSATRSPSHRSHRRRVKVGSQLIAAKTVNRIPLPLFPISSQPCSNSLEQSDKQESRKSDVGLLSPESNA